MKRIVFAILAIVFAASSAFAVPSGEKVVTATGVVSLGPAAAAGPIMIEAYAVDGTATIILSSSTRTRTWPDDNLGDSDGSFYLAQGDARPFPCAGEKIDSVVVTLGTATKVVVTWTVGN